MRIELSGAQVALLKRVGVLLDHPMHGFGVVSLTLPDGSEAKTLEEVAALNGYDRQMAAIAVTEAKHAPACLLDEAKDVHTLSGQHQAVTSLGTRRNGSGRVTRPVVIERARGIIERDVKPKKRKRKKKENEKVLTPAPFSDFEYVCIMLQPVEPPDFAMEGGSDPEDMHVTVLYDGTKKAADYSPQDKAAFMSKVLGLAQEFAPFTANVNGTTRFSMPNRDPLVVNVDSPVIERIRRRAVDLFGAMGSEHGYTPHMTLGYIDHEDQSPIDRIEPTTVQFAGFQLAWGNDKQFVPFTGIA